MNCSRTLTFFAIVLSFAFVSSLAFAQDTNAAGGQFAVASQDVKNFGDIKTFKKGLDLQVNKLVEGTLYTTAEENVSVDSALVPLLNAKLALLDSAGNVVVEVVTNESGKFSFGTLKSGIYSVLGEAIYEDGKRSFGVVRLNVNENANEVDEYVLNNPAEVKLLLTDDLYYFDNADNLVVKAADNVVKPEASTTTSSAPAGGSAAGGGGAFGSGLGGLLGLAGLAGLAGLGGGGHHSHPVSTGATSHK